jgi:hypothetical protein
MPRHLRVPFLAATSGLLLGACAASGPSYQESAATAPPIANGAARLVLLRPKDMDDGGNGGGAVIRLNGEHAGSLRYGGFFHVDFAAGPALVMASGRYPSLGACEIQVMATAGETIYVDVGPRTSYMVASLLGSVAGGLIGSAAVPAPETIASAIGIEVSGNTAATLAGSVAGEAAAVSAEGRHSACNGPYQLAQLPEQRALDRLEGLGWSR